MTARSSVAFDLAGDVTFVDPHRVEWHALNDKVITYTDTRIPGTKFHFAWVGQTQTGRWFLRGNVGIDRWHGCNMGKNGHDYLEVTPEQAAAWFLYVEKPLPPELADVVSRHLGEANGKGKPNDSTNGDDRQGAGKANEAKGKTDEPATPTLDDLTLTAWRILETLRKLEVRSVRTAVTREAIAKEARDIGNADSRHFRTAYKTLMDMGLITMRKNVGTWIMQVGLDATKRRK